MENQTQTPGTPQNATLVPASLHTYLQHNMNWGQLTESLRRVQTHYSVMAIVMTDLYHVLDDEIVDVEDVLPTVSEHVANILQLGELIDLD